MHGHVQSSPWSLSRMLAFFYDILACLPRQEAAALAACRSSAGGPPCQPASFVPGTPRRYFGPAVPLSNPCGPFRSGVGSYSCPVARQETEGGAVLLAWDACGMGADALREA